ncbi:hypothetical protein GGR57DRAFT_420343 [Xylariaceae sp. FL1272]|nr:hypothetical protein GGR57DRAFT_420343 [Xylariaceae sp. FL1272]
MVIDTACSSSIYALHTAIRSIENNECDGAIVAGANLVIGLEQHIAMAAAGVVSPSSSSHTFDARADGYGRAEGIAAIYLKSLSQAIRDRDNIWSVIRGTSINSDGWTTNILKPNVDAQASLIRAAYFNAGIDVKGTDYVECHGTGTAVGDAVEVEALHRCFGTRERRSPLLIGSAKPGLGHSEATSGLTSIIKVSLAFHHGLIPPTYGVKTINPQHSRNMKVATSLMKWPRTLRRASINNFGYGGSNAHAILESLDSYTARNLLSLQTHPPDSLEADVHSSQDIPLHPWDYSKSVPWKESRTARDLRQRAFPRDELLGTRKPLENGVEWSWRNVLEIGQIPWVHDHKVKKLIIFPAAAYFQMALSAMSQIDIELHGHEQSEGFDLLATEKLFEFSDVYIGNALILRDDSQDDIELHTRFSRRKLSPVTTSSDRFDFSITSWRDGKGIEHSRGTVRLRGAPDLNKTGNVSFEEKQLHSCSTSLYYDRLWSEGLCYGPSFRSLKSLQVDLAENDHRATSTTQTKTLTLPSQGSRWPRSYPVHPFALDACLQTAIMGLTKGDLSTLRTFLPVSFSRVEIRAMREDGDFEASIHSRIARTGLSSIRTDCTLQDENGNVLIEVKDSRLVQYGNAVTVGENTEVATGKSENVFFSSSWKPDILRLHEHDKDVLSKSLREFMNQHGDLLEDRHCLSLVAMVDLVGHKFPSMRVLDLSGQGNKLKDSVDKVFQRHSYQPYSYWHTGAEIDGLSDTTMKFDLIFLPRDHDFGAFKNVVNNITLMLSYNVIVVSTQALGVNSPTSTDPSHWQIRLCNDDVPATIVLHLPNSPEAPAYSKIRMVVWKPTSNVTRFTSSLTEEAGQRFPGADIETVELSEVGSALGQSTACVLFIELEREFLATMTAHEMECLKAIISSRARLIWVSGADLLGDCPQPNLALIEGFSKSLVAENPSLQLVVVDVGLMTESKIPTSCRNILAVLSSKDWESDRQFVQRDGALFINRLVPDPTRSLFLQRRIGKLAPEPSSLSSAVPVKMVLKRPGDVDSIYFQQICQPPRAIPSGFVDIRVQAISLNAKDVYALRGKVETRDSTMILEFGGVVEAIGPDVRDLQPGDRVVVFAPSDFATTQRVPASSVHKIKPDEDMTVMPTLLTVYATALYALNDRARLQAGESVLIHAGAGALGIALITIAKRIGACVYCTVGSPVKRRFLQEELGIPISHIFNSRDESFVDGLMRITEGRGVDVVVNSLVGDLLHASWGCIAELGRFVEVGKRDIADAGNLNMHMFLRNATFTAFDLADLWYYGAQQGDVLTSKLRETLDLYRKGEIKPAPITVIEISEVAKAYRRFSDRERIGKIVVSLQAELSIVPTLPPKYQTILSADKVYLLVGCLGGLGRSLSRWMVKRGAKTLVFLNRSGDERREAQLLLKQLQQSGATVSVFRGDVSVLEDVQGAFNMCQETGKPLGGVVQGAMAVKAALFDQMTHDAWTRVLRPKYLGTWNLHSVLNDMGVVQPDFFLLLSSIFGTLGSPTESNYSASNAFLDAFARWSRIQGRPTVSVGLGLISEVGFLHENPEAGDLLSRRGVRPLSEEEFLQVIDIALSSLDNSRETRTYFQVSHLLTGLEPATTSQSDDGEAIWNDPSMAILLEKRQLGRRNQNGTVSEDEDHEAGERLHVGTTKIAGAPSNLEPEKGASSLQASVLDLICRRLSILLSFPTETIATEKPISDFNIDSLIGSELRFWFWSTFKVDVPYLDITTSHRSLKMISEKVTDKLMKRDNSGTTIFK